MRMRLQFRRGPTNAGCENEGMRRKDKKRRIRAEKEKRLKGRTIKNDMVHM